MVRFERADNGCNNSVDRATPRCDLEPFYSSRTTESAGAFLKMRVGYISTIYTNEETHHGIAVVRSFLKL